MAEQKEEKQFSEPSYAKPEETKNLPWYTPNIEKRLTPSTIKLLEQHSGIPPDQQSKHVHQIRDKAWAIRTYPCTGLGIFLIPYIGASPAYDTILTRLKNGEQMIDIGCFLGGDFRRLVFDGAPSENMLGIDIANHWEIGYDLFRDRDRFNARFLEADLMAVGMDRAPAELRALKGEVEIIHVSAVLHQWDWDGELAAAKKLVYFSKPGTLVVGHQIGSAEAKEVDNRLFKIKHWHHNPESLERMWKMVGAETGTEWKVQAWMRPWEVLGMGAKDAAFMEEGDAPVDFVVERTA